MNNNNYELYHFGILGMKWGIRRFQNEDGTLTPAGKERYRTDRNFHDRVYVQSKLSKRNNEYDDAISKEHDYIKGKGTALKKIEKKYNNEKIKYKEEKKDSKRRERILSEKRYENSRNLDKVGKNYVMKNAIGNAAVGTLMTYLAVRKSTLPTEAWVAGALVTGLTYGTIGYASARRKQKKVIREHMK